jgi:hypothetical protein
MNPRGTFKVMAIIVALHLAMLLPALVWDGYLDTPFGLLAVMPFLSVYLFHALGVPGLLEHGGACGWGWCSPTPFGWFFVSALWLALVWIVARSIVYLRSASQRKQ